MRPAGVEVHVIIVESWEDELACEVDHLGVRSGPFVDVGGRTDSDDPRAAACHSFGLRLGSVYGPDFRIGEDEVGKRLRTDGGCKGHVDEKTYHVRRTTYHVLEHCVVNQHPTRISRRTWCIRLRRSFLGVRCGPSISDGSAARRGWIQGYDVLIIV